MNTTKRTYKHSEAWLAKHAAKATSKKLAIKSDDAIDSKATPKKRAAKTAKRAAVKKLAKHDEKKLFKEKKLAMREAKKLAREKKLAAKKAAKIANKDLMKRAVKLFNVTKKCVSATKKQTKAYGKMVSEALKAGDPKTVERLMKLFGRIGYSKYGDDAVIKNVFSVKIKIPKIKKAKKDELKAAESEKTAVVQINDAQIPAAKPVVDVFEDAIMPESPSSDDAGPTDDELNDIENEMEAEEQNGEETESDEFYNNEQDDTRDVEDLFDQSEMRDRFDAFREMEEAQRDNGDWED